MSPMVSFFACFIVLPAVGFVIIGFAVRSYFRPTSEKEKKTIVAILVLTGLLTYYLFTDKAPPPPAPFAEHNTTVLATVKEGDLILCTDPASDKVQSAFLLRSIFPVRFSGVSFHGILINRSTASAVDVFSSYFDRCRFEVLRDDGLGNVDQKIGKIIRFGLNPQPPLE
jgi:hypothetical protein